jgi:hypothetical protein
MSRKRFNPRFSRRSLLLGLGAGVGMAPFVPLLESRAADGFPQRLILLFSANGTIYNNWRPSGTEHDFTLGPILAPLEPFKDDLIVIDGLRFNSGGAGNNHMSGPSKFTCGTGLLAGNEFTGGGDASSGWGGGKSIDQVYADEAGKHTPFASLELGVRVRSANPRTRLSYAGPNQPIPPESNPYEVFNRLFAEFGHEKEVLERLRADRSSVIDVVKAQTERTHAQLSAHDKHKLDAHLSSLREIERRLENPVNCDVPVIGNEIDWDATENYETISQLQMDLLVMAMACDLTRVSTFMWNGSTSGQTYPWLGFDDEFHYLSHEGDSNTAAQDKLTAINTWHAEQVAYLLELLDSVPEGDGTMLDNTIVLWGNELGKGNSHTHVKIPFVMAGGGGGAFETGRYLSYGNDPPNNRLLVSILNGLGFDDITKYGELDNGSGPLPGL